MAEEKLYGVNINLDQNELILARLHDIGGGLPSSPAPIRGQLAYNSTLGVDTPHWYNGSAWRPFNYIAPGSLTDSLFTSATADLLSFQKLKSPTSSFSFNNQRLTNLATPTQDTDAVNKLYVNTENTKSSSKFPVRVATNQTIVAVTYSSSQGTLTSNSNLSINQLNSNTGIDNVNTLNVNDRILVKNQTEKAHNGIYLITQLGSISSSFRLTRALDADTPEDLYTGITVYVREGSSNEKSFYTLSTTGEIIVGVTPIEFTLTSGLGSVQTTGGININGNTISANVSDSSTIGVISDSLKVKSSIGIGQVLISTGNPLEEADWGTFNLASPGSTIGFLPVSKGGTGGNNGKTAFDNLLGLTLSPGDIPFYAGLNDFSVIQGKSNTPRDSEVLTNLNGIYEWKRLSLLDVTIDLTNFNNLPIYIQTYNQQTLAAWFFDTSTRINELTTTSGLTSLSQDPNPNLSNTLTTNGLPIVSGSNSDLILRYVNTENSIFLGTERNYLNITTDQNDKILLKSLSSVFNETTQTSRLNSLEIAASDLLIFSDNNVSIDAALIELTNFESKFGAVESLIIEANLTSNGLLQSFGRAIFQDSVEIDNTLFVSDTSSFTGVANFGEAANFFNGLTVFGPVVLNGIEFPLNLPSETRILTVNEQGFVSYGEIESTLITVPNQPINYTVSGQSISDHLTGIDIFLSNISNFSNVPTDSVGVSTGSNVSYNQALPSSSEGTILVTHNLNSTEVFVSVYEIVSKTKVYTGVRLSDNNSVILEISGSIPANTYRVVIVKPSIVRRYSQLIPNPLGETSILVEHNFDTEAIIVRLYEGQALGREVYAQVSIFDSNTISLTFTDPPLSNQYRVVIVG